MLLQWCSSRSAEVTNCLVTSRAAEFPRDIVGAAMFVSQV